MSHVFISYVREDEQVINYLVQMLRANGVEVWLDRDSISPGERWKPAIRHAISSGDFFLYAVSKKSLEREKSYANEELVLAIDELRQRPVNRSWFIPVRLDKCEVPDRGVGGGETLRDFQWVDLFENWNLALGRILRVLGVDDPVLEIGEPLGSGLPAFVRFAGGKLVYQSNSLNIPALNEMVFTVTDGWCKRMEDGHVLAFVQTQAPFADLQATNELVGLAEFYCVSDEEYVSSDPDNPNTFAMRHEAHLPAGIDIRDVQSSRTIKLPVDLDVTTTFVAAGYLDEDTFSGSFTSTIDFGAAPISNSGEFDIRLLTD